jgi:hypothetical protein
VADFRLAKYGKPYHSAVVDIECHAPKRYSSLSHISKEFMNCSSYGKLNSSSLSLHQIAIKYRCSVVLLHHLLRTIFEFVELNYRPIGEIFAVRR